MSTTTPHPTRGESRPGCPTKITNPDAALHAAIDAATIAAEQDAQVRRTLAATSLAMGGEPTVTASVSHVRPVLYASLAWLKCPDIREGGCWHIRSISTDREYVRTCFARNADSVAIITIPGE